MRFSSSSLFSIAALLLGVSWIGLSPQTHAAISYEVLHSFQTPEWTKPTQGTTALVRGADGNFYGGGSGGPDHVGVIYKVTPAGEMTVLHALSRELGNSRITALIVGPGGDLYGTAQMTAGLVSPAAVNGVAFRLSLAGVYTHIGTFVDGNDLSPYGKIAFGADGNLYGVTYVGGEHGLGTIFRITPAGVLTTVHDFTEAEGGIPFYGLTTGADGAVYGASLNVGQWTDGLFKITAGGQVTMIARPPQTSGPGTLVGAPLQLADGKIYGISRDSVSPYTYRLYRVAPGGVAEILHTFGGASVPPADLVQGLDGRLYVLAQGQTNSVGQFIPSTLYRMDTDGGNFTQVATLTDPVTTVPQGLAQMPDGSFYTIDNNWTYDLTAMIHRITTAGAVSVVARFDRTTYTSTPSGLVQAADGSLYGTVGAMHSDDSGAVIRLRTDGQLDTLAALTPTPSNADLVPGPDGNYYGVTIGSVDHPATFFRVTPAGVLTTLGTFDGANDYYPQQMVLGGDGNFYGILAHSEIFRATPQGVITTVADFVGDPEYYNSPNGYYPEDLIAGNDGNLYGITRGNGVANVGTVFRLTPAGDLTTVHTFDGEDGVSAPTRLLQARDGTFYGLAGSDYLFKLSPDATVRTVLHHFGNEGRGYAQDELVEGADGAIYGLTTGDGAQGQGTLFRATAAGEFRIVHQFDVVSGTQPSSLSVGQDGALYGTTRAGGAYATVMPPYAWSGDSTSGGGTIFRLRMDAATNPFESWLAAHSVTGGAEGDDDADGVSNLQEYASGTDPKVADAAPLKVAAGVVTGHGSPVVTVDAAGAGSVVYLRRKDRAATGLAYTPQWQGEQGEWWPTLESPQVIGSDAEFEAVRVQVPSLADPAIGLFQLGFFVP